MKRGTVQQQSLMRPESNPNGSDDAQRVCPYLSSDFEWAGAVGDVGDMGDMGDMGD